MLFMEQFCKDDPVLLIPIKPALAHFPFVIAGTADPRDSAQKIYRVFYFEFFENFVVFPLPVTYILAYYESEEGQREFAKWKAARDGAKTDKDSNGESVA